MSSLKEVCSMLYEDCRKEYYEEEVLNYELDN